MVEVYKVCRILTENSAVDEKCFAGAARIREVGRRFRVRRDGERRKLKDGRCRIYIRGVRIVSLPHDTNSNRN